MDSISWLVLLIFIPVVIFALSKLTKTTPAPQRLEEWAKTNELQIVSAERRRFFVGPFMLQNYVGDVYRIVVRGRNEETGEGWLSLRRTLFGEDWEEVKWIRKPAQTVEPVPNDIASPYTRKWTLGVFLALVLIFLGLISLTSGRFIIPSRKTIIVEGTPALLLAAALISLGIFLHLQGFWNTNPKGISIPAQVFGFVAVACIISAYILTVLTWF